MLLFNHPPPPLCRCLWYLCVSKRIQPSPTIWVSLLHRHPQHDGLVQQWKWARGPSQTVGVLGGWWGEEVKHHSRPRAWAVQGSKAGVHASEWAVEGMGPCALGCVCACSVTQSCLTLCDPMCTRLLRPWNIPGKNTGAGCHFLHQGIFPTQGSNPHLLCLLHWQVGSLPLSHLGSPDFCKIGYLSGTPKTLVTVCSTIYFSVFWER